MTDPADPELLARLRHSGIRVDREGELWHEGEVVRHAGLRAALFRWMDEGPDGQPVLRLDQRRFATLEVEDTPLVVRAARWQPEGAALSLSDGAIELLDPATLTVDDAGVLRCRVRGGRLEARLANSAAAVLSERLEGDPPALRVDGRLHPLRARLVPAARS